MTRDILDLCCSVLACTQYTENETQNDGCLEWISEQKCSERRCCYKASFRRTIICRKLIYFVSIVLLLSQVGSISADLIGHWRFDESSGKTASDSIAGNDGTLEGIPKWVAGQLGNALEFDGDDWVDCGDILNITGAITIACWINPARSDRFIHTWVARWDAYALIWRVSL